MIKPKKTFGKKKVGLKVEGNKLFLKNDFKKANANSDEFFK